MFRRARMGGARGQRRRPRPAAAGRLLVRVGGIPRRCAAVRRCRTPRRKTHSTATTAEATVAYAWHPWAGRLVHVHEVIERATGAWARCGPVGAGIVRPREIPTWMFDASVCRSTRRAPEPVAALSALVALRALLTEAMGDATALPAAAVASAASDRGGRHAPPPSPVPGTGAPTRSLLGASAADRGASAGMEQPTRWGPAGGDGADDPPADHARGRRGAGARGRCR